MPSKQISAAPAVAELGYIKPIDGLRALAIIVVIINHFDHRLLPHGYLGVDVFFVISGFVITRSLLFHSSHTTAVGVFADFYRRRFKRLAPALVLCVALTTFVVALFDPSPDLSLKTGLASLVGISNLYLHHTDPDYFGVPAQLNAFTHTWSLGVEEQFYVVFPAIFLIATRLAGAPCLRRFTVVMLGLSAVSVAAFAVLMPHHRNAAFYMMPTRLWELGAGCLAFALCHLGRWPLTPDARRVLPVTAVLILALFQTGSANTEALTTALVVLLSVLLITDVEDDRPGFQIFSTRPLMFIGRISYSLYLWHWPVLVVSRLTIGVHWWTAPFQLAAMVGLAALSSRYVERPLRAAAFTDPRWRRAALGAAILAGPVAVAHILVTPTDNRLFLGQKEPPASRYESAVLASDPAAEKRAAQLVAKCNMTPQFVRGGSQRTSMFRDKGLLDACLGMDRPGRKLIMVGDSFTQASAPNVSVAASRLGLNFQLVLGYTCPFPLRFEDVGAHASDHCANADDDLLNRELMAALHPGDLLVVRFYMSSWLYLAYPKKGLPPVTAYDAGLEELARRVRERGARLLVIGANPTLSLEQREALTPQWFKPFKAPLAIHSADIRETAYFHQLDQHLIEQAARTSDFDYFSLRPYLCEAPDSCRLSDGPHPLYFDKQHITAYANDLFFEALLARIRTIQAVP